MKNQCQHLIETKPNELIKLLQKSEDFLWNNWYPENRSSRLQTKRGYKDDMFKTIYSTKGTKINV